MNKIYDNATLKEISENVNLFEYVNQFLEFEKRGEYYFAHCPRHQDITPSLCITQEYNRFHCFSCNVQGNIINYLQIFEKLKFEEAVNKAAKLAKVDLSKICHSNTINFLKNVKMLNHKTKEKYEHPIIDSKELIKYQKEVIPEWLNEEIRQEEIDLFGVLVDTKQNRIVYPVYDIDGNLINIKGRTRYPNYKNLKIAKYINYFTVGCMDYFQGLNITLPYIKEKKEVIIFESIKSIMKAYGWGYKNCVSAEKHTLTSEQVDLLIKLRADIVFAYDTDVDYKKDDVWKSINKLKRMTNVFIIKDKKGLLGGAKTKNAPVDVGKDVWEYLYQNKKKVV